MKKIIILFLFSINIFVLSSCSEKISYTGLIIDKNNFNYENLNTKNEVISNLGNPSFVDPIEKKYFYFSEKIMTKNYFNKKIDNRILVVFNFNDDDMIINVEKFDLNNEKNIKIVKKTTSQELISQGLIEKLFGGIGKAPTSQ